MRFLKHFGRFQLLWGLPCSLGLCYLGASTAASAKPFPRTESGGLTQQKLSVTQHTSLHSSKPGGSFSLSPAQSGPQGSAVKEIVDPKTGMLRG